jgi:twinkle protein
VRVLGIPTGVIYLEQGVAETARRVAGKSVGKRFHVPDGSWTQEELREAVRALRDTHRLHLYDNWGAMDWPTIKARIRYMASALGCQHIYLDHLTALAASETDERVALEKIMAEAASMAQSLKIVLHYVSHLTTPEGKPHEEGGRVTIRHFKGSRAIGFWSHFMFGLERDQQGADRGLTFVRCLKDRNTGQATGRVFPMRYDETTGMLNETDEVLDQFDPEADDKVASAGF